MPAMPMKPVLMTAGAQMPTKPTLMTAGAQTTPSKAGSAVGCAEAACGAGGATCGQVCGAGAQANSRINFVGPGQGMYVQNTEYQYVGRGAGEFIPAALPDRAPRNWCLISSGGTALVAVIVLILVLFWPMSPATTTAPLYDCNSGIATWQTGWTLGKKAYCCETAGMGCPLPTARPTQKPMPAAGPLGYCNQGGVPDWSEAKKEYCCKHFGNGCATTVSPYDCSAGLEEDWMAGWSMGQKHWCCQTTGRGCAVAEGCDYDCNAGFDRWQAGWSVAKKWCCCKHTGKGCE